MKATDILKNEHRVIEQALRGLEGMAFVALQGHTLVREDAKAALDFIRAFADRFHHVKEEDLLFVEMGAVGFAREAGPLAVMLYEHATGRERARRMASASDEAAAGNEAAQHRFAIAAGEYIDLVRGHIRKEDDILYPLAEEALGSQAEAGLLVAFARAEEALGGVATRDRYSEIARKLGEQYGSVLGTEKSP